MENLKLENVDVDGAIREAADAVSGDTRMGFLRKGAVAGGAALSGGAILSALVPGAAMAKSSKGAPPSSFGKGDIGILNYALTLEYLESAFYNAASKNFVAHGDRQLNHFLTTVKKDEAAHVAALKKALGSKAVKTPKFDFGKAVTDKASSPPRRLCSRTPAFTPIIGQAANISNSAYLLVALPDRHDRGSPLRRHRPVPRQGDCPERSVRHGLHRRQGPDGCQGHRLHHRLVRTQALKRADSL